MHISILDPQSSEWLNLVIPLSVIIEEKILLSHKNKLLGGESINCNLESKRVEGYYVARRIISPSSSGIQR